MLLGSECQLVLLFFPATSKHSTTFKFVTSLTSTQENLSVLSVWLKGEAQKKENERDAQNVEKTKNTSWTYESKITGYLNRKIWNHQIWKSFHHHDFQLEIIKAAWNNYLRMRPNCLWKVVCYHAGQSTSGQIFNQTVSICVIVATLILQSRIAEQAFECKHYRFAYQAREVIKTDVIDYIHIKQPSETERETV